MDDKKKPSLSVIELIKKLMDAKKDNKKQKDFENIVYPK